MYECSACGKSLPTQKGLRGHRQISHGIQPATDAQAKQEPPSATKPADAPEDATTRFFQWLDQAAQEPLAQAAQANEQVPADAPDKALPAIETALGQVLTQLENLATTQAQANTETARLGETLARIENRMGNTLAWLRDTLSPEAYAQGYAAAYAEMDESLLRAGGPQVRQQVGALMQQGRVIAQQRAQTVEVLR